MTKEKLHNQFDELLAALTDEKFAKPQVDSRQDDRFDLKTGLETAFANPLFYPPLAQSVFPGDTIAIVVQNRLPHAKRILEAIFLQLSTLSIEPQDISVVVSRATAKQMEIDPKLYEVVALDADDPPPVFSLNFGFQHFKFQVHDAANEAGLSYLVANEAGDPVMINRMLVDADVVLPVGYASAGEVAHQIDSVYPEFGNEVIKRRFKKGERSFLTNRAEIELANDTLGSFFSLQIVFGPGNTIQGTVCGARKDAMEQAREKTAKLWALDADSDAAVVITTLEDHAQDQDWDDFVTAVNSASRASNSDAPIVVWSNLEVSPDRDFKQACNSQFEESDISKLGPSLQFFANVLRERPVFLASGLKRSVIEELGIGFLKEVDEVVRIAAPFKNGLLIRDAHKCQLNLRDVQTQEK